MHGTLICIRNLQLFDHTHAPRKSLDLKRLIRRRDTRNEWTKQFHELHGVPWGSHKNITVLQVINYSKLMTCPKRHTPYSNRCSNSTQDFEIIEIQRRRSHKRMNPVPVQGSRTMLDQIQKRTNYGAWQHPVRLFKEGVHTGHRCYSNGKSSIEENLNVALTGIIKMEIGSNKTAIISANRLFPL